MQNRKLNLQGIARLIASYIIGGFFVVLLFSNTSQAQEFEPRSLGNLPVNSNFAIVGYGYTTGNILLDPAITIEDLDARLHGVVAGYLRSFNFFGKLAKVDVVLPYAIGDWDGTYDGTDTSTSRNGFGDARIRLSVNLFGSPPLKRSEFGNYVQKTIV